MDCQKTGKGGEGFNRGERFEWRRDDESEGIRGRQGGKQSMVKAKDKIEDMSETEAKGLYYKT